MSRKIPTAIERTMMRRYSESLRARRVRLGLTTTEAARLADVCRNTYEAWERGVAQPLRSRALLLDRAMESLFAARKAAAALEVVA